MYKRQIYGDVFKIPEQYIPKIGARVMSRVSPENKMSKSGKDPNGTVYLLDRPEDIMRKFKKAVDVYKRQDPRHSGRQRSCDCANFPCAEK